MWLSGTENACLCQLITTLWHQLRGYQMLFCSQELFTSPIYIASFLFMLFFYLRNFCWAGVDLPFPPRSVCSPFFASFRFFCFFQIYWKRRIFPPCILWPRKSRSYLFLATSPIWWYSVQEYKLRIWESKFFNHVTVIVYFFLYVHTNRRWLHRQCWWVHTHLSYVKLHISLCVFTCNCICCWAPVPIKHLAKRVYFWKA